MKNTNILKNKIPMQYVPKTNLELDCNLSQRPYEIVFIEATCSHV